MILMNNFKAEPEGLRAEELAAARRVFDSGWFILGQEVSRFETAWAGYCGAGYAVGVGNGLDALEIGLRTLDVGPGDEVITTPMTAMATTLAIVRAGAKPVFADICPDTALLDPLAAERAITSKTKAILLVHLYGQVRDMENWRKLCDAHGIHLIEDCAQSHGARWNGKFAGTFGSWGGYSFYPTKNLGAKGDGGALVTDSEEIASRAKCLRNYGQQKQYNHCELGMNSRLDEMQAAILSVRLGWLERFTMRRKEIADVYYSQIDNPVIKLPARPLQPESHVQHLFVVRCDERDRLSRCLHEKGIQTLVHYPLPLHQQPCARAFAGSAALVNAETHSQRCLSIPCHPQLTHAEVSAIVEAMNEFR